MVGEENLPQLEYVGGSRGGERGGGRGGVRGARDCDVDWQAAGLGRGACQCCQCHALKNTSLGSARLIVISGWGDTARSLRTDYHDHGGDHHDHADHDHDDDFIE